MGYWLQIDRESQKVTVHRDTSPHHRCRWIGKNAGRPQPAHWVYQETPLQRSLTINNTVFPLKPCTLPECMRGTLRGALRNTPT